MPSPARVCYMTPLNIVSNRSVSLHESSSTQRASSDELLRRCDFDWAEDVEDAATNDNSHMPTTPDPLGYPLPKADIHNEIYPTTRYLRYPNYKPSLPTVYEEVWDETLGWVHGTQDITSSSSERIFTDSDDDTTDLSTYEGSPINDELAQNMFTVNSEPDLHLAAQQSINNIFGDRQTWINADAGIHHFNWMGLRVYTRSSTSPSDSLAIILAKPKKPQGGAMWRVYSVLNRATQYIDPVLVFLDHQDESLFELRGSELVRASAGRVFKFYSPHGMWMEDSSDTNDDITTDFGNTQTYEATGLAVGNGFVESSAIRSLSQWTECRDEASEAAERSSRFPRRRTWERKPSPLRQCESIKDSEYPEASSSLAFKQAKRPPRKITTCVAGAPREEYFSFPTPIFGRYRAIKKAFQKVQRGWKSMLRSIKHTLS
ncbi:hypothetical protein CBS147332_1500 [Penicillium roqueforti]|nr:hypothetical protein CBS147332_1500 [Penicillium roqueforti]KAI3123061.1 hypothetical protein CBS147331_1511 [Penicillium roqueforti]